MTEEMKKARPRICVYCEKSCEAFAGDPGQWPLGFPHADGSGVLQWHHVVCVVARMEKFEERIAELEAQLQRAMDLVRYARHELFNTNAITQEEYAALVFDSDNGQRVARLETYDGLRARLAALEAERDEAIRAKREVEARVISVTWGELYGAYPEVANQIQPHEWDNKNTVEQQGWLLEKIAALRAENARLREELQRLRDVVCPEDAESITAVPEAKP